jgi:hypothetical protein
MVLDFEAWTLLLQDCLSVCRAAYFAEGEELLCGGGFEYLHRSPASRRRRREGKVSNLRH